MLKLLKEHKSLSVKRKINSSDSALTSPPRKLCQVISTNQDDSNPHFEPFDPSFDMNTDINDEEDDKLFVGSPHSKLDYCLAITMLARKTQMSDRTLNKVLSCVQTFMPISNKCPSDIRTLKGYIETELKPQGEVEAVLYCNHCSKLQNECHCGAKQNLETSFLQKFKLFDQIMPKLNKYSDVREKYKEYCRKHDQIGYVDSLNGTARKNYHDDVVSIAIYLDGIKLRKSSNKELWILGATLLDLPMKIRSAQKNLIPIAAWYGSNKPIWSTISNTFDQEISLFIPYKEQNLSIVVLQVNADIPARASFFNCMQSGYCPCLKCNIKGERVQDETSGQFSMKYLNYENDLATTESYLNDIKIVEEAGKNETVVCPKGHCAFTQLFIPECVTADVMHTVYYGPLHDDIKCILKNKTLNKMFDECISNVKWPSELSARKLRQLSEINLFKASEWKSMILYISVPTLLDFISRPNISEILIKQCKNILLATSALLLLMKDIVTEANIQLSKELLEKWFHGRNKIFPHNEYTLKTHEMTHFPDQVRIHGPLQSSSCFAGENILNKISNMVTANQGEIILKQIAERFAQESCVAEWKAKQLHGPLHKLISILDDNSQKNDQLLPHTSILAKEIASAQCTNTATISDYIFASSELVKYEKDSFCIFSYQNTYKVGCIEYIVETNGEFILQMQPYEAEIVNNIYEFEFHDYYILGEKMGEPLVCRNTKILRKGIIVQNNTKKMFVPLAHVFEHN